MAGQTDKTPERIPEPDLLREAIREDIVEHVDHILKRVAVHIQRQGHNRSARLVANAIDDVLLNKDRD